MYLCLHSYVIFEKYIPKLRTNPVSLKNPVPERQAALTAQGKAVAKNRHHLPFPQKILPGKVVLRNFRDGLIQVAGLKWKHYSMSWH